MKCERMGTRLIAYLDGRAGETDRCEVEAHLAECSACRARAEEFRRLWGVLAEVPMIAPSLAFDAALRQRIAAEPSRSRLWAWLVPSPRLVFAVSLLVVLSVWLASRPTAITPAPPANSETEFKMIEDLPVLENYDVVANFEALSDLPVQQPTGSPNM